MTQYNEAQMSFREKSKSRIQRQLEISKSHMCIFIHSQAYTVGEIMIWSPADFVKFPHLKKKKGL